ncbi:FAD-dependent oxidoreductase [Saccharothrix obliqua]|uniref:FAD-dependent oxidoreductase n=1 Tax=Saccharothrix obliqua TaxID=2861747 RepID=UPI001C5D098D|nr:FAD-dependent oxidoreductase [Saccharothrix obliqua]MBW4716381.1 FAD-dependent oxidoreductase [Saccharothrix obliqua]
MTDVDVVVVGGGVMGSAAAWRLASRGVEVALFERFARGHVLGSSHGASRIFRLAYRDPVYVRFAAEAREGWRALGGGLLTETGGVDHGDITGLPEALAAAGEPGEVLSPDAARERWPGFRFDDAVFHHPASGRLHADRAVARFQDLTVALGGVVRYETPVRELRVGERVEVVTEHGVYRARRVVVAVGSWTAALLDGLVPLPPLVVTQEQPAHFAPVTDATWPAFIHRRPGGVYGLETPGEGVKVGTHGGGPVVDPDARDFRAEPTRLAALRRYVRDWLPGLDPAAFTPISCTYTSTPTEDFVLDRRGPLVVAAGFSGHGFKFAPAVGRVLADLATSGPGGDRRFALDIPGTTRKT